MEHSPAEFQDMHTAAAPEHRVPQARFFTPGVVAWTLLGGLAAGYLALVALKPDALAGYIPSLAPWGSPEDNEGQRATAANELQAVRDGLSQVQLDMAKIKTDLAARDDRETAVETRLSVLEDIKRGAAIAATPAAQPTAAAAAAPASGAPVTALSAAAPAATAATKAAAKKAVAAKPVVAPAAAAAPIIPAVPAPKPAANAAAAIAPPLAVADPVATPGVKLINSPLSQSSAASKAAPAAPAPANAAEAIAPKLETGSLQNLGASTAGKPLGVYIASGPSVDSLRQSWSVLTNKNAETLGSLEPRYTTGIDANGLNYGLVAGPVKSAADAQKLCRDLAAKAVSCRVGDFTGEAL